MPVFEAVNTVQYAWRTSILIYSFCLLGMRAGTRRASTTPRRTSRTKPGVKSTRLRRSTQKTRAATRSRGSTPSAIKESGRRKTSTEQQCTRSRARSSRSSSRRQTKQRNQRGRRPTRRQRRRQQRRTPHKIVRAIPPAAASWVLCGFASKSSTYSLYARTAAPPPGGPLLCTFTRLPIQQERRFLVGSWHVFCVALLAYARAYRLTAYVCCAPGCIEPLEQQPWYRHAFTRVQVNEMLTDVATGTFIVRQSSKPGIYVLRCDCFKGRINQKLLSFRQKFERFKKR